MDLIGVLATNEEVQKATERDHSQSVFINKGGDIQYYVKMISRVPKPENFPVTNKLFTGYMNSISDYENFDNVSNNEEQRIEDFRNYFSKYLFVFNYRQNYEYFKLDRANITKKIAPYKDGDEFIAVPVFSAKENTDDWESKNIKLFRSYNSFEDFITCIKSGQTIGKVDNFEYEENTPDFLIWKDDKKVVAVGPFKDSQRLNTGYILQYDDLGFVELEDELDYFVQLDNVNPTVAHIIHRQYDEIYNRLLEGKISLNNETTKNTSTLTRPKICNQVVDELIKIDVNQKTDSTIIELFKYYTQKSGLFYKTKDLINFHTAIKTGSLVILSGMSGTGKSRIVDIYSKTLGIQTNTRIIPVRPSWNDDSDLLGYVDLVHMVYRPSDTGFVKTIMEASKNTSQLYLICFDEMNLARIEHYFSQFLSILEKPVEQRELRLYDSSFKDRLYNSAEYSDVIEIGSNVKFVGTVNIDESTYNFSDKVLDRSNVICLDVVDYSKDWKVDKYGAVSSQTWSADDFNALITKEGDIAANTEQRKFLWALHNLMQKTSLNLGVGPRIVKQIEIYLSNLPKLNNDTEIAQQEGFDIQITQRILTKIRGSEEQLSGLLGVVQHEDDELSILDLFDTYSQISLFTRSRAIVEQKRKELKVYGYCI